MSWNNIMRLINEEIFLSEIFNNVIDVDFSESVEIVNGNRVVKYVFKTKNENEYSLYFTTTILSDDMSLENKKLSEIIDNKYFKFGRIPAINIGFTTSDWDGNNTNFSVTTNNNEMFDLLGRIAHLVNIYKSKNNVMIFIVGNDKGDLRRLRSYELMYSNLFSSEYSKFKNKYLNFEPYAMFFIKNNILKLK